MLKSAVVGRYMRLMYSQHFGQIYDSSMRIAQDFGGNIGLDIAVRERLNNRHQMAAVVSDVVIVDMSIVVGTVRHNVEDFRGKKLNLTLAIGNKGGTIQRLAVPQTIPGGSLQRNCTSPLATSLDDQMLLRLVVPLALVVPIDLHYPHSGVQLAVE